MPLEITASRAALCNAARVQHCLRARIAVLFVVVPLLGGCGFHLRGEGGASRASSTHASTDASVASAGNAAAAAQLPAVLLQIDRARTPLAAAVVSAMGSADIRLVGAGTGAGEGEGEGEGVTGAASTTTQLPWRVRVREQHEERRGRTLTRGIQVAEYELNVALEFEVLDEGGAPVHAAQRLAASRVYSREQENLLTNEAEEDVLWDELRRDVAAQLAAAVATQLSTAAQRPAPPSGTTGQ